MMCRAGRLSPCPLDLAMPSDREAAAFALLLLRKIRLFTRTFTSGDHQRGSCVERRACTSPCRQLGYSPDVEEPPRISQSLSSRGETRIEDIREVTTKRHQQNPRKD
eukprot:scaffold7092_cov262-Pinguiococcus_pyrenoidosus.AAC.48